VIHYTTKVTYVDPSVARRTPNVIVRGVPWKPATPFIEISSSKVRPHRCAS
jgi:hypothetical protein